MPSLSGQPIDFGGGHVGWLPVEEHARSGRPRSEVDSEGQSKQAAASSLLEESTGPMVEGALIQPVVTTFYRRIKSSIFAQILIGNSEFQRWGGKTARLIMLQSPVSYNKLPKPNAPN